MRFGAMTNPRLDPITQTHWIGQHAFDYIDLAVEPPQADHMDIDCKSLTELLGQYNLGVIVHTSPFLPIANPHEAARRAARTELLYALDFAHHLGSELLSLHYLAPPNYYSFHETVDLYVRELRALIDAAQGKGVTIALENSPTNQGELVLFREIFQKAPEVRLLLDLGHSHINSPANLALEFLEDQIVGNRLSHVHVSDNDGLSDLHLPLGSVRNGVDWKEMIGMLRRHPYDGTVTLEIFSPDREYLLTSRDKFRTWWNEAV
jgi:sugar phosphate isomerase/epimerase